MRALILLPLLVACSATTATSETSLSVHDDFARVVVDSDAGAVDIIGSDTSWGRIDATSRYSRKAPKITAEVRDGTLFVDVDCPRQNECSADLTIPVPHEVHVQVELGAGPVTLDAIDGRIDVWTGAGAIDGFDLVADDIRAETKAGAIALDLAEPPTRVVAYTKAGAIDLDVPRGGYQLDLRTKVGMIEVYDVIDDSQATGILRAHTSAGAISVMGR